MNPADKRHKYTNDVFSLTEYLLQNVEVINKTEKDGQFIRVDAFYSSNLQQQRLFNFMTYQTSAMWCYILQFCYLMQNDESLDLYVLQFFINVRDSLLYTKFGDLFAHDLVARFNLLQMSHAGILIK